MSWTDDRVEILKKMWGEGQSASQIAKELGGVTRNAVIGKVHRLGLSNRTATAAPAAAPAAAAKPEAKAKPAAKPAALPAQRAPLPRHRAHLCSPRTPTGPSPLTLPSLPPWLPRRASVGSISKSRRPPVMAV